MIQNFKYFSWGCFENAKSQYGLYNLVADCFILVTPDYEIADKLKTILSSRYELVTVELSCADNFTPNLIDNTVCTNWSFEEKTQLAIGDLPFSISKKCVQANTLCATSQLGQWNLIPEQEYSMMCQYWITFLNRHAESIYNYSPQFDEFLPLTILAPDKFQQLVTDIYCVMYLGQNLEQVEQEIKILINNSELRFSYE